MYIHILSPIADKITVFYLGWMPWDKSASDGYWLFIFFFFKASLILFYF